MIATVDVLNPKKPKRVLLVEV